MPVSNIYSFAKTPKILALPPAPERLLLGEPKPLSLIREERLAARLKRQLPEDLAKFGASTTPEVIILPAPATEAGKDASKGMVKWFKELKGWKKIAAVAIPVAAVTALGIFITKKIKANQVAKEGND